MLEFRKAKHSDSKDLKSIAERIIRLNYTPFLGVDAVSGFLKSGMSEKEIDNGINDCIVALHCDKIIGFAITKEELLHLIMIDIPYQNKGYGSQLLFYVENDLFNKFETIRLQSFKENENAVQFYLKKRWKIKGEELLSELGKTMLFFEKSLTVAGNF